MKKFYAWYQKHITGAIFIGLLLGILTGLFLADRFAPVLTVTRHKIFSFFLLLKKVVCLAEILLNIQNITKIIACTRIWCQEILQYYNIEGISLEKFILFHKKI